MDHADEQDASEKRVGQLVEARCYRPVVLDLIEEALNEVALAVECEVAVADLFSVGLGRNDGRDVFEQRLGLRYIVNLPRRERERDWIVERIEAAWIVVVSPPRERPIGSS